MSRSDPFTALHPPGWRRPKGYSNGLVAEGRLIVLGGQIGWNAREEFDSDDFVDQARQALRNIIELLGEAGAGPQHLVRLTWYVTDRQEYLASTGRLGEAYREVVGRHFPAMTLVQVVALVEARAKVEIEALGVIPVNVEPAIPRRPKSA